MPEPEPLYPITSKGRRREFVQYEHAGPWQSKRKFYERDRQGRFSSLLIVFSFVPWRSAPTDRKTTNASACVGLAQSCADSSRCSVRFIEAMQAVGDRSRRQPMFYLRLTSWDVAVTLVLVIRGGLWLGEYLDLTGCRATLISETSPRALLPDHRAEERNPHSRPATRLLCRLHR